MVCRAKMFFFKYVQNKWLHLHFFKLPLGAKLLEARDKAASTIYNDAFVYLLCKGI